MTGKELSLPPSLSLWRLFKHLNVFKNDFEMLKISFGKHRTNFYENVEKNLEKIKKLLLNEIHP
jgi:hypothetical protein